MTYYRSAQQFQKQEALHWVHTRISLGSGLGPVVTSVTLDADSYAILVHLLNPNISKSRKEVVWFLLAWETFSRSSWQMCAPV